MHTKTIVLNGGTQAKVTVVVNLIMLAAVVWILLSKQMTGLIHDGGRDDYGQLSHDFPSTATFSDFSRVRFFCCATLLVCALFVPCLLSQIAPKISGCNSIGVHMKNSDAQLTGLFGITILI
jgi:hypothetical protein